MPKKDADVARRVVDVVRALGVVVAVAEAVARLAEDVRAVQVRVALVRADLFRHGVAVVVHEVHAAVPAVQLVRGAGLLGQLPRREVPRAADVGRVGVARARERLELAEGLVAV